MAIRRTIIRRVERAAAVCAVPLLGVLARVVPLRLLRRTGSRLAAVAARALKSQRRRAFGNLRACFPEFSDGERERIWRQSLRSIIWTCMEFFKLPYLSPQQLADMMDPSGVEHLRRLREEGRGIILLTGHFGNWEYGGAWISDFVAPVTVIARMSGNRILDDFAARCRASHGITTVSPRDTRAISAILKDGGIVATLVDQPARSGGLWSTFLGRPALTYTGPISMAIHTGAAIVPAFTYRCGDRFRGVAYPPLELASTGDREADLAENVRRLNAAIEQAVMEQPESWLWLYDRWRERRPRPAQQHAEGASPSPAGHAPAHQTQCVEE